MTQILDAIFEWIFGEGVTLLRSLPWLLMLMFAVPFLIMARRRCYPSLALVLLLLIPAGLAFIVIIADDLFVLVLIIDRRQHAFHVEETSDRDGDCQAGVNDQHDH